MAGPLCYSKDGSKSLIYSKTQGSGYLVYKGEDESSKKITIEVSVQKSEWVCAEFNCTHTIVSSVSWGSGITGSGFTGTIEDPQAGGTYTFGVSMSTGCSSSERPSCGITVVAMQEGSNALKQESDGIAEEGSVTNFTLTLDGEGKLQTLN